MTSDTERSAIYHVTQRLSVRFPMVDAAVVGRVVQETQRRFDDHPIREFVPILVETPPGMCCGCCPRLAREPATRGGSAGSLNRGFGSSESHVVDATKAGNSPRRSADHRCDR